MIEKSRLTLIITVVAVCIASPAFAQSFDSSDGTGNSLPTYYGPHGGLHRGTATQNKGSLFVRTASMLSQWCRAQLDSIDLRS
jgi:hypothetical protein